ncbi:MAG: DUF5615 family PIN-like protein [Phaeodactylibacter sp.]|nr:DUF5615 family PIN-like protein [Phaeodactylibacter sp.]MCB9297042.1 DUF5615 family PIN-like protein [Lewinellaceae bacterium]
MKFLLDVHLGRTLADFLVEDGHECRLVAEVADPRMDDVDILELARKNEEIVLTHDLDFGTLLAFNQESKPSVVIFRIEKINSKVFAELLIRNWADIKQPLQDGAIIIIEPSSIRIRSLPI